MKNIYGDAIYESREEMQVAATAMLKRAFKSFTAQARILVANVDEEEITDDLWGPDALIIMLNEAWEAFDFNPDGEGLLSEEDPTTEEEEEDEYPV